MKWNVIDSIACPDTGIIFTALVGGGLAKVIIWYEGEVYIAPGSVVEPIDNGVLIDGEYHCLNIFNICVYDLNLWSTLKLNINCDNYLDEDSNVCILHHKCALKKCPYMKKPA